MQTTQFDMGEHTGDGVIALMQGVMRCVSAGTNNPQELGSALASRPGAYKRELGAIGGPGALREIVRDAHAILSVCRDMTPVRLYKTLRLGHVLRGRSIPYRWTAALSPLGACLLTSDFMAVDGETIVSAIERNIVDRPPPHRGTPYVVHLRLICTDFDGPWLVHAVQSVDAAPNPLDAWIDENRGENQREDENEDEKETAPACQQSVYEIQDMYGWMTGCQSLKLALLDAHLHDMPHRWTTDEDATRCTDRVNVTLGLEPQDFAQCVCRALAVANAKGVAHHVLLAARRVSAYTFCVALTVVRTAVPRSPPLVPARQRPEDLLDLFAAPPFRPHDHMTLGRIDMFFDAIPHVWVRPPPPSERFADRVEIRDETWGLGALQPIRDRYARMRDRDSTASLCLVLTVERTRAQSTFGTVAYKIVSCLSP